MYLIKSFWIGLALSVFSFLGGCGGASSTGTPAVPAVASDEVPPSASPQGSPAPSGYPSRSGLSISGEPAAQVTAGENYAFTAHVSNPAGHALSFSIVNLPPWARWNPAGILTGTPSSSDIGSYTGIRISVTDGQATATLTAFSIQVVRPGNGKVTVSWIPPTQNIDGSALNNLAGFFIHYGRSRTSLDRIISIADPAASRYFIDSLAGGTWHFAVSAVNARGIESPLSETADKNIEP